MNTNCQSIDNWNLYKKTNINVFGDTEIACSIRSPFYEEVYPIEIVILVGKITFYKNNRDIDQNELDFLNVIIKMCDDIKTTNQYFANIIEDSGHDVNFRKKNFNDYYPVYNYIFKTLYTFDRNKHKNLYKLFGINNDSYYVRPSWFHRLICSEEHADNNFVNRCNSQDKDVYYTIMNRYY